MISFRNLLFTAMGILSFSHIVLAQDQDRIEALVSENTRLARELSDVKKLLNQTVDRLTKVNARIDSIRLVAADSITSSPFACGQEQLIDTSSTWVMYGSRDGTGCGVPNLNYYKRLEVSVPQLTP